MSTLISAATGLLSAAGTWKKVAPAGLLESTGASTALTTGNLDSATFVLAGVEVDAVAVRLASRAAGSPTNTITIILRNSTTATDVLTKTINVSDLPVCTTTDTAGGWIVFAFGANHTPNGTDSYVIRATLSATSTAVSLYRDGTANNWARMVRETTTQAPVAGDNMLVAGEHTGAGTGTDFTVTMDSTAATDYGTGNTSQYVTAMGVAKRGTLTVGTTAATNYILRLSGNFTVFANGTFKAGDATTQIPRDSSFVLELNCGADGDFGLRCLNLSTVSFRGLSRTSGKDVVVCKLNTDEAAAQTVLGVDTDTGWLSGDEIGIASTTRTTTQYESRTLASNANAADMTVTAGLTNAHGGDVTSKVQAEVILLTRNVKIRSVTAGLSSFVYSQQTGTLDMQWVEFRYIGSGTATTTGVYLDNAAAFTIRYCVMRDGDGGGFHVRNAAHTGWSIRDTWRYNASAVASVYDFYIAASSVSPGLWTLADVGSMGGGGGSNSGYNLLDLDGTMSNLSLNSRAGNGIRVIDATYTPGWTIDGLNIHAAGGLELFTGRDGTVKNFTIWRQSSTGGGIQVPNLTEMANMTWITGRVFGNPNYSVWIEAASFTPRWTWRDVVFAGDSSFSSARGIYWAGANSNNESSDWVFENCTFGVASGIYVAHSTADLGWGNGLHYVTITMNNCVLASTELDSFSFDNGGGVRVHRGSYVAMHRHDQTANNHRVYTVVGNLFYETTTVDVSPGLKMTPLHAAFKLESSAGIRGRGFLVPVANAATKTPSVKVQKDGTYNGNPPRLLVKANPALGISTDTVLDTHSIGSGSFETLTGTTIAVTNDGVLEFVVDCDGTAGNIFVDTWTA